MRYPSGYSRRSPVSAASKMPLTLLGIPTLVLLLAGTVPIGANADDYEGLRRTDTEHFSFIYEPRDRESVAELTEYADDVFEVLTGFLENRPSDRIRVFVNGRTDIANGYFDPRPRHHLGLFIASPSRPLLGARTESWLRGLFIHELTHYVHFMYEQGLRTALSRVFGTPLLAVPGAFLPGWAIEGIAIEAETRFTDGGRGRNPYYEIYYAADILAGTMYDYSRAGYDSASPPPGRYYVAGMIFVDYLLDRFGDDTFTRVHQEFLRFPILGFDRAIRAVTGYEPEALWDEMVREMHERYEPRRSVTSGDRLSPERTGNYHAPVIDRADAVSQVAGRVTPVGDPAAPAGDPAAPAGDPAALHTVLRVPVYTYRTAPGLRAAIVRLSPDGEETVVESTTLTDGDSLDVAGGRMLFASVRTSRTHPGPDRRHSTLYLREPDGGVRRISEASGLYHPRFVRPADESGERVEPGRPMESTGAGQAAGAGQVPRDGQTFGAEHIIAVQRRGQYHRLVWVNVSTGGVAPLYEPDRRYLYTPAVSPDGRTVAFAERVDGRQRIRTLPLPEPGHRTPVPPRTPAPVPSGRDEAQYQPAWDPDGGLLYVSDRGGQLAAMRQAPDRGGQLAARRLHPADEGSESRQLLATDPVGVLSLAVTPDGTLVYGSYRDSGYTIMTGRSLPSGDQSAAGAWPEPTPDTSRAEDTQPAEQRLPAGRRTTGTQPDTHNDSPGQDSTARDPASGSNRTGQPLPGERRFFDLPLPSVWFPYPSLLTAAGPRTDIGVGLGTFGANYQRSASVSARAAYHPRIRQPTGSLEVDINRGRFDTRLEVGQRYGAVTGGTDGATTVEQRTTLSGITRLDLISRVERGRSVSAGPFATATFEHLIARGDGRDFAFNTDADAPGYGEASRLRTGVGLYASYRGLNTRRDLYPNRTASSSLRAERDIQSVGNAREGLRLRLEASTVLPLSESGTGVALEGGAAYTTGAPSTRSPFTVEGIGAVSDTLGLPGRFRASAGIQSTVALLDTPIPFGFNLQGLALGVFGETQGGFASAESLHGSGVDRSPAFEPTAWLRFEALAALGYNIGVANVVGGMTLPVTREGVGSPFFYIDF